MLQIPYLEANENGKSALPKGVALGLGGLVLKPVAGAFGLGAYTAKGIRNSFRSRVRDTKRIERWIRRARMAQGQRDVRILQEGKGGAPECQQSCPMPQLFEVRKQALHAWAILENNKNPEEREAQKRLILNQNAKRPGT